MKNLTCVLFFLAFFFLPRLDVKLWTEDGVQDNTRKISVHLEQSKTTATGAQLDIFNTAMLEGIKEDAESKLTAFLCGVHV